MIYLFSEEQKEILRKNFEILGEEFVFRQAQEEAAEFIVAINHYLRCIKSNGMDKPDAFHEVLKEFVDLVICLVQIYVGGNECDLTGFVSLVAKGIEKTLSKEKIYADS